MGMILDAKHPLVFDSNGEVLDDLAISKRLCIAHHHRKAFGQISWKDLLDSCIDKGSRQG